MVEWKSLNEAGGCIRGPRGPRIELQGVTHPRKEHRQRGDGLRCLIMVRILNLFRRQTMGHCRIVEENLPRHPLLEPERIIKSKDEAVDQVLMGQKMSADHARPLETIVKGVMEGWSRWFTPNHSIHPVTLGVSEHRAKTGPNIFRVTSQSYTLHVCFAPKHPATKKINSSNDYVILLLLIKQGVGIIVHEKWKCRARTRSSLRGLCFVRNAQRANIVAGCLVMFVMRSIAVRELKYTEQIISRFIIKF